MKQLYFRGFQVLHRYLDKHYSQVMSQVFFLTQLTTHKEKFYDGGNRQGF